MKFCRNILLCAALLPAIQAATADLDVSSELLKSDNGTMIFSGNVGVEGLGITLRADELAVDNESKVFTARGSPAQLILLVAQAAYTISGPVISYDSSSESVGLAEGGTVQGADLSLSAGTIHHVRNGVFRAGGGAELLVRFAKTGSRTEDPDGKRLLPGLAAATNELHASARSIEYDSSSGKVVLSGSAVIRRGEERLTGDKIEYSLSEGSFDVKAKPGGRVRAVINSP